jgi:very-short-patch-repair endonuclease
MRWDKSDAETKLWQKLRELNRQGFHFRQQAPIGPYIADFCDHTARLVIEVDGAQHGEPQGLAADERRTRWLEAQGYRVLRFWNHEVLVAIEGVEVAILIALGLLREDGRDTSAPSPLVGEGQGGGDGRALAAASPAERKTTEAGSPHTPSPSPPGGAGSGHRLLPRRETDHA